MATSGATGRVIRDSSAWDELDATGIAGFSTDLDPGFRVLVTYKRVNGEWEPWTLVTQSARLKAIGVSGRGLYTLQRLRAPRDTNIGRTAASRVGRYSGTVLGTYNTGSPESRAFIEQQARSGKTSLLSMRLEGTTGWAVVDGNEAASAPYAQRSNDYRGIAPAPNVRFTATGYMDCMSDVPAASLLAGSLSEIAKSELLVDYGDDYWGLHRDLGSSANPIVTNISVVEEVFRRLGIVQTQSSALSSSECAASA